MAAVFARNDLPSVMIGYLEGSKRPGFPTITP